MGNSEVLSFVNQAFNTLFILASLAATFFLVKGGYSYITSTGKPDAIAEAKTTIRNACIGLIIVISATVISGLLQHAFITPSIQTTTSHLELPPLQPVPPQSGLAQVLMDGIVGVLQNIIQSATKPLVDGIISLVTTTPSIVANSVIFNFWLVILGITDSLFVLLIAALGFYFMSASTFGFEEIEFKHLLPRVGLAFLGANTSIFLADWVVQSCNVLIQAILRSTGGIANAWILNAFDPINLVLTSNVAIITLIFMVLFVILSVVLLLFYITRLIAISLGAVLSPIIFLLWAFPKFSDFAEISIKSYVVTVYSVFVHVVIIQLASAFLAVPGQSGSNSLIAILVGIGLLFTLLKTQSFMMQLMFYNSGRTIIKRVGGQIMNVINATSKESSAGATAANVAKKATRRVVRA